MKVLKGISGFFIALSLFYLADFFVAYRVPDYRLILLAIMGFALSFALVNYKRIALVGLIIVTLATVLLFAVDFGVSIYWQNQSGEIAVEAGETLLTKAVYLGESELEVTNWVKREVFSRWGIQFGEWLVYDRISAQILWGEIYDPSVVKDKELVRAYNEYEHVFSVLSALVIGLVAQLLLSRWIGFAGAFLPIVGFIALWFIYVDLPGTTYGLYFFGLAFHLMIRQAVALQVGAIDRQGTRRIDMRHFRVNRVVVSSLLMSLFLVVTTGLLSAIIPIKTINVGVDSLLPNIWGARTEYDTQDFRLYSLGNTGYQEFGSALGGPVGTLDKETPLFWLEMEQIPKYSVYLKGQIKHIYDGKKWVKSEQIYNNQYESYLREPRNRELTQSDSLNGMLSGRVTFDALKTISIFAPIGFFESSLDPSKVYVSSENQAFYKGGMFVNFLKSYTFKATQRDFTAPIPDDLQISSTISPELIEYLQVFKRYGKTPEERISFIVRYLKENYTYNLAVKKKRVHPDFVTDFLLESREGYCTYFASAMVVMARVSGVPARYVEGFRVDPSQFDSNTSTAKVTEADAHAWVVVYFEDEGWRVVEATAPYIASALQPEMATTEELESAQALSGSNATNTAGNQDLSELQKEALERLRLQDMNLENDMNEDASGVQDGQSQKDQMGLEADARAKANLSEQQAKEQEQKRNRVIISALFIGFLAFSFIWWWPVVIRFKRVNHSKLIHLIYGFEDLLLMTQERSMVKGALLAGAAELSPYKHLLPSPETFFKWEKVLFSSPSSISSADVKETLRTVEFAYDDLLNQHRISNGFIKHWIFRAIKRV